ncbi:hypothetical protein HDA32_005053 [Spinactinospora alkalitolerans]|uniref:DUF397 domain-containing protein n=2 Tax=Spinactinospora alkalitolerans TaxID=687207 RepID=A0A852U4V5_9ACTN|nr:DUF397 domain-containing protein [Spinactinospora alkalitolerans]NYE49933.1 hypothetical protein [Spinactinospora alkalitolerans]
MMTEEWNKASYSNAGSECVECRTESGRVSVRDTRNRDLGHLSFPAPEWRAFLADIETL